MTNKYEKQKISEGYRYVLGCDEVGRGCLAGPVVAASVILDFKFPLKDFKYVNDSKLLSEGLREELSEIIKDRAIAWSIGEVSPKSIDALNIHHASLLAMRQSVDRLLEKTPLDVTQTFIYVDGKFSVPHLAMSQEAIIDGDAKVLSIAAASIVAKVYRDNLMKDLDKKYPGFELHRHKGYATSIHCQAIQKLGLSPIHRLSFCSHLV